MDQSADFLASILRLCVAIVTTNCAVSLILAFAPEARAVAVALVGISVVLTTFVLVRMMQRGKK